MKVAVDSNILVRAVVQDDKQQGEAAAALLREAELVVVPAPCLCEFVWVLRRVYDLGRSNIAAALHALVGAGNVTVSRPAVDAGLAVFEAGGDFADGLIAHEGYWLGGEVFASFDKNAIALIARQGQRTLLLA